MMGQLPIIMPAVSGRMDQTRSHSWSPIEDLPDNWQDLIDTRVTGLAQAWQDQASELKENAAIREFVARLCRQFAIETGAIEQIYHITQSATETLIEHGLNGALLSHYDTVEPTELVMARIDDQHQAIQAVYEFVASRRSLGTWYLRAMHEIVTANQQTHTVRDTLGQLVERPLLRGEWKKHSNSVKRTDGYNFEYCPPEQVASEIDRLLEMHAAHMEAGVSPVVEAAWLHHRFVLIHPFADGNGRMARLLASMVLLKAGYLPLVVTRADKPAYIEALQAADDGNFEQLVQQLGRFQRRDLLAGLRLGDAVLQPEATVNAALAALKYRLQNRSLPPTNRSETAQDYAALLHATAVGKFNSASSRVAPVLQEASSSLKVIVNSATFEDRLEWTSKGTIPSDATLVSLWVVMSIGDERLRQDCFLQFGKIRDGVFICRVRNFDMEHTGDTWSQRGKEDMHDELFEFSYASDPADLLRRFDPWLDTCIAKVIRTWTHLIA